MHKKIINKRTVLLALMSAAGLVNAASSPWEGSYFGADVAGAFNGNSKLSFPGDAGASNQFSPQATGGTVEHSLHGTGFGVHFGENRQIGNVIIGLEGSFAFTDISTTKNAPFSGINSSVTTGVNSLSTLTPRVGYALGNWLPYAKAGLAIAEIESSLANSNGSSFHQKHLHEGWTAGVGVEYALPQDSMRGWILGLEYNYYQFLGKTYGGRAVPDNTWPVQFDLKPTFSTLMLRASYNFGARSGGGMSGNTLSSGGNWDGVYAGLSGLGAFNGSSKLSFPSDAGALSQFSPQATGGTVEHSLHGTGFGVHLGDNRQIGNVVIGLEGSFAFTDISTTKNAPFSGINSSVTTGVNSLSTLTPRVGYALGNWLPYAKAGLAIAEIESSLANSNGSSFQQKHLHEGWTAGVGIEYALPINSGGKWIVGLDCNYYQFLGKTYGGRAVPDNTWPVQYDLKPTFSTIAARVSYKF